MKTLNDYLNDQLKNPEYAQAYEEVKPEIDAIRNSKGNDTMSSVFIASPTEVIKVGEPLSNSDEIRQAFENGEIYKRGFEDARKRYERPQGEWILIDDVDDPLDRLNRYKCSECGRIIRIYDHQTLSDYPYCHCGADMRGAKNE